MGKNQLSQTDMYRIRAARKADAAQMMEVRLAVLENAMTLESLHELGITVESVADMLENTHVSFCAEDQNRLAGFSMGDRADGSVFALFVRPEYEGQGLGKALLNATVEALWEDGKHAFLKLRTGPQTRAYTFYIMQGWVFSKTVDDEEVELELHHRNSI